MAGMSVEAPWPVALTPLGLHARADAADEDTAALPPVSCGAMLWRTREQMYLTVIVKATFGLLDEAEMVLEDPEPILRAELHHQNVPTCSVRATTDLVPFLRQADVVLTGHAHAPGGAPVPTLAVRLAVLRERVLLDKALLVVGDRRGDGPPQPFARMPLTYERAYGGIGWKDNPFGVGTGGRGAQPNVIHPEDAQRTAGFAPIARGWPARKQLLGAEARRAMEEPIPLVADGVDWAYFQAAPPDQRVEHLRGDEWIVLEGVHPGLPRIRSRLPGVRAAARIHGLRESAPPFGWPLDLVADTLRIDADEQRCSVTWRGMVPVRDEAHAAAMHVLVALARQGEEIAWPEAPPVFPALRPTPGGVAISEVEVDDNATTLVRGGGQVPSGGTVALTPEAQQRAARRGEMPFQQDDPPGASTVAIEPEQEDAARRAPATPFSRGTPAAPPRPSSGPRKPR